MRRQTQRRKENPRFEKRKYFFRFFFSPLRVIWDYYCELLTTFVLNVGVCRVCGKWIISSLGVEYLFVASNFRTVIVQNARGCVPRELLQSIQIRHVSNPTYSFLLHFKQNKINNVVKDRFRANDDSVSLWICFTLSQRVQSYEAFPFSCPDFGLVFYLTVI